MVGEEDYPTDGVDRRRALPGSFLWAWIVTATVGPLKQHKAELYVSGALSHNIEKGPDSLVFIQRGMSAYGGDLGLP